MLEKGFTRSEVTPKNIIAMQPSTTYRAHCSLSIRMRATAAH